MPLTHHAQPGHPERWTRLGWKWEERRDDLLSYQIVGPPPSPTSSKGLPSWLHVDRPERQKQHSSLHLIPPHSLPFVSRLSPSLSLVIFLS